jgi:hypothetical protein
MVLGQYHILDGSIHFLASIASTAANFRLTCGAERRAPECSTQRFRAATPHVGQGTEDNCLGESSLIFIKKDCDNRQPQVCAILYVGVLAANEPHSVDLGSASVRQACACPMLGFVVEGKAGGIPFFANNLR